MKKYRLTLIGLVAAILTYTLTIAFDLELFEKTIELLEESEAYEIDEIILPALLFLIFAFANSITRQRAQKVEIEKQKIYEAMLGSSHHVLNNLVNQMQLFRLYAEETEDFPKGALKLYDQTIDEATAKIKAMGEVTKLDEESISLSVHPEFFEQKDQERDHLNR